MVFSALNHGRTKIALISAISALGGAANIWLMVLINRNIHRTGVESADVAEFALFLVGMVLINFLSQTLLARFSAKAFFNLREQLVRSITELSSKQIDLIGSSRLYTALTRDVPAIHELIIVLPNYVFNFTVVVACLIYLTTVSLPLFGIFLGFLAVALGVSKFVIADRAEEKFRLRRKVEDDLFQCYEAVIDGNKELKLNSKRKEEFVERDLRQHAEKYRQVTLAAETLWNLSSNWSSAAIFVGIGALLFLSPSVGVTDRADVVSFIMVIFYMVGPLTILMNSFRTIYNAKIGLNKLNELELGFPAQSASRKSPAPEPFQSLTMMEACFRYDDREDGSIGFGVGPLNLEIVRGEIVYFVGGNGSGKTTAAKLLTGLYELHSGAILVNGRQVTDLAESFQAFSAVFQDYYLFQTLVPKGKRTFDDAGARAMVERLRLSDKVTIDNGRISTTKLSYGQRKRLALLVAYFDDSEIYVFDEWAADQDPEFREFFYKELLFDLKRLGKTIVVVSHDDRYFHLADKVVKFENGKMVSSVQKLDQRELEASVI